MHFKLIQELGRHRGREGNKECELCGNECQSCVVGVFSIIIIVTVELLLKLQEKLGNGFERFDALDSLGKSPFFILGSELWEEHFDLPLVKDYVDDIWEARKIKLYDDESWVRGRWHVCYSSGLSIIIITGLDKTKEQRKKKSPTPACPTTTTTTTIFTTTTTTTTSTTKKTTNNQRNR